MPGIANAGQSQHSPDDASDPPISERASDHFVEEEDKKPWKPPSLAKWYIMWLVFAFIEILTSAEKASFNHLGTTFNDYFDNYRILSIGTLSYMTASAVFKPLTGRLTDIFSDTTGMLVGNGLYVLGCGICAGAYFLPPAVGQSIFLIGRTLIGVGSGTISSILNKFKDACSEKWHFFMRWLFTLYAATGSSVGPWVGGLIISSRWGWHPTFWGQGVSILLCAIVTHCTICELPKDTKKTKNQPASAQDLEAEHVDEPDDPLELPEPDDPEAEASALEAPETPAPETPLSIRQKLLLIDWVGMVLYAVGMVLMITGSNAISSKGIATCVALIALSIVFFFLFFSWGKLLQKRKRGRKEARAQAQAQGDPVAHTAPVDNLDSVRLTSAQREMEGSSTSVPTSAAQTGPEDIHERIAPRDTGETLTSAPTGIDRSATSRTWGSIPTLVKFFVAKNLSHVGTSFSGAGKAAVKAGFDFGAWFYEVYPEVKPFIKTRLLTDWSALSICLTSGINHTSYWLFKIHIPVYLAVHGLNKRAAGTWMVAPGIASFAGPWIIGLIGYLVRTARKRPTKEEIEAREHERTRQRNRRLLAGRAERRSIRRNLLFIAISCTIGMLLCAIATVVSAQSTLPYKVTILLFAGITACYAPLGNLVQVTIKRAARKPDDVTDTKSLLFAVRSICDALVSCSIEEPPLSVVLGLQAKYSNTGCCLGFLFIQPSLAYSTRENV